MSWNSTQHVCSDGSAKLAAVMLFCVTIPAVSAAIRGPLMAAPMITVRVVDYAGVPGQTLREATTAAQRIFRKAGVETRWLLCSPPQESEGQDVACARAVVSGELRVDLEPKSMEKAIRKYFRMSASAFGTVFGSDGRSTTFTYVLYGRIEEASLSSTLCSRAVLLGHVLAHEIGHLLLGSAHSRLGLMSANWNQRVYTQMAGGQLEFSDDEAQRLHAEAGGRNRQQQADTDGGLIVAR